MRSAFLLGLALLATTAALGAPLSPLDGLKLEDLSATRDRPLFAPTRRPPPQTLRIEAPPAAADPAHRGAAGAGRAARAARRRRGTAAVRVDRRRSRDA